MCKQETIDKIDKGTHVVIPKWWNYFITGISPVAMITFIFWFGSKMENVDQRIFKSAEERIEVVSKVNDQSTHMPYQEKIKVFVPRTEIEYKLDAINLHLKEIKEEIKQ